MSVLSYTCLASIVDSFGNELFRLGPYTISYLQNATTIPSNLSSTNIYSSNYIGKIFPDYKQGILSSIAKSGAQTIEIDILYPNNIVLFVPAEYFSSDNYIKLSFSKGYLISTSSLASTSSARQFVAYNSNGEPIYSLGQYVGIPIGWNNDNYVHYSFGVTESGFYFVGRSGADVINRYSMGSAYNTAMDFLSNYADQDAPTPSGSDPYSPGGYTEPEEGATDGEWELPTDSINTNPSVVDSTQAGLFRTYAMTLSELQAFGAKLWTRNIIDTIVTHFESPLSVVTGVLEYPFPITPVGDSTPIAFNWIEEWAQLSSVYGRPLTSEYQVLDFGSINIGRYSGTFYDYQPYSSAQLYLPYIGYVPIKINEVLGKTLSLKYVVSLTSGAFAAVVQSTEVGVIGVYTGSIGRPLPLSSRDMFDTYATIAASAIAIVAGGLGSAAASSSAASAGAAGAAYQAEMGVAAAYGDMIGASTAADLATQSYVNQQLYGAASTALSRAAYAGLGAGVSAALNSAGDVASSSGNIPRSGSFTSVSGRCSPQEAGVLITVPHQNISEMQQILGFPANLAGPLEDFEGYTQVRHIVLSEIGLYTGITPGELTEIAALCKGGIIIT